MDMNKEETFNEAYDRLMRTGRSHTVYIDDRKHVDAERWCRTHFGKRWSLDARDGVWACFWGGPDRHSEYRFNFARQADALIFTLKWS
jgi:hypothetical protein